MSDTDIAAARADNEALAAQVAEAWTALEAANRTVESILAADNRGWVMLGEDPSVVVPDEVRRRKAVEAVAAAVADPLIKRGLAVRAGYVWGDGVQVTIADEATDGQDVGAVLARLKADCPTLFGMVGQLDMERDLGTVGEVWLALPTTKSGRVRVRRVPAHEVSAVITDPEDVETTRFVARTWTQDGQMHRCLYPALGYRPAVMPRTVDHAVPGYDDTQLRAWSGAEIRWDAPIRPVIVNRAGRRGTGDAFASLPWSQAYSRFLEAWHRLMQALARFAWQAKTSRPDKASQVAARIEGAAGGVGQTAVVGPDEHLEAIGKSGATFDAGSAQPLLAMVSAGLGIPATILSSDPGTTGARAVAETLDTPTINEFRARRAVWADVFRDVAGHAIDSAVRANKLQGDVSRDGDSETITLPDGDSRAVVVSWPPLDQDSITDSVSAIVAAAGTDTIPDLTIARMILEVLGVQNLDDVLDQITDDDGNFVAPSQSRAATAARALDQGA